ncbi:hypothetical protein CC86DRAFT_300888 [Ophiobolus disseminans]|uniref:Uncharacterized protein n=1 Tax=Ophiobolus disseminans TaxID=1469910 RepID=A0A6A6ZNE5_9PLEO|nr:hypothetical protein CC86DRAFT_300888 [Ophiobolus disseminans]
MVLERRRHKQEARLEGIRLEQMQPSWQNPPRDIEIHTRGTRKHNETPTTTGRLTKISEEEISTGGEVVRRRHASKSASGESGRFKSKSGGSGGLEDVLLECLVP